MMNIILVFNLYFVVPNERRKGIGGCFLTFIQDLGKIIDSNNIIPIILMRIKR